jgi:hypothetical protein
MRILVLSFSDLRTDPRVIRQIQCLRERYEVTVAGFNGCAVSGVRFIRIDVRPRRFLEKASAALLLKARRYEDYYWSLYYVRSAWTLLQGQFFDAVIANDINTLPLALRLSPKVLFDAHEYSPREFEERWTWRFLLQDYAEHLCRSHLPRVASMITVSQGIADEYRRVFGAHADVVTNVAPYCDLAPAPLEHDHIRLVHHGAATPARKLESMIRLMDLLDARFQLELMLVPVSNGYLSRLKKLAHGKARVHFREPVAMPDIPRSTNRYDIGIALLPGRNFNNDHALPNKFFEFIQARLAVAVSPSAEMAAVVSRYKCGIVADDYSIESLAARLNALTPEAITHYKHQSNIAARELCFENFSEKLLQKVREAAGAA